MDGPDRTGGALDESKIGAAIEFLRTQRETSGQPLTMERINKVVVRQGLTDAETVVVWQRMRAAGLCQDEVPIEDSRYFLESWGGGKRTPQRDALAIYLLQVARRRALTREEEASLSRLILAGRAAQAALDDGAPKSPELERAALQGKSARRRLIEANLRLAVHLARPYARLSKSDLLDLIQEGTLGLFEAVERYDPEKGFRFSTYAVWWIRQAIQRILGQRGRAVRLPDHIQNRLRQLRHKRGELAATLGRIPRPEELSEAMGYPVAEIELLVTLEKDSESIDVDLGSEAGSLQDFLADQSTVDPADATAATELPETLNDVLDDLDERERTVVQLRFGLDGNEPITLDQVAAKIGCSRERARQLEQKALERLAHPSRSRSLFDFLPD